VFCPNCGTQNPDTAQTCSKCNFNVKGAAAPKFKGTMLMMNQPGVPAVPQAPPGQRTAPGTPPPPGAGAVPSKLKGTMVGVAPMALSLPNPPPPAPAAEAPSAFSPPVAQPGVNPLGGTLAADAAVFGAFAAQQQAGQGPSAPHAAPPLGQSGSPATAPSPMYLPHGGPAYPAPMQPQPAPQPFGGPPPLPGASGPPQGAPQPSAYGGADAYGHGQSQPGYGHPSTQPSFGGAMVGYGQPLAAPMVGTLNSAAGSPTGPTRRNALLTLLLPAAVIFGGSILSVLLAIVLSSPAVASLASVFILAGFIWSLVVAVQMISELKTVTRSEELAWWPLIVPVYQLYFMWIVVPQQVVRAKQMLGSRHPPQHVLLYVFLWPLALALDLNDMAR
jgi:hypothetical protein